MELAIDKCAYLNFRGGDQQYKLMGNDLAKSTTVKDLVSDDCRGRLMYRGNNILKKE